jgi:diguanylate cyclase (GGDEF)-like protein/PAS domain S-box-containing protein
MLPTLLPLAVRLLTAGNELAFLLGIITLILIAGIHLSALRMHRAIVHSLSLGFENQALFIQSAKDKRETDRLNTVLLSQIAERRRVEQALKAHERELRALTDELELRVAARTEELWQEIEERKRTENILRQRSRALEQSGSTVLIVDRNALIEYVNPRFSEMTGYPGEELIGNMTQLFDCPDSEQRLSWIMAETFCSGQDWRGELKIRKKNGESYWSLSSISRMQEEAGRTTHLVVVGEDLTQVKETQAQMEQLAYYDTLTGLANRRLFRDRLEQALSRMHRDHKPLALIHLDVDQFKRINDTQGHDAGDLLLQTVAQRLASCVRQQDTVARMGGDEFTVLLTVIEGPADAGRVAHKILKKLREPVRLASGEVVVTSSLGIAVAPEDAVQATHLMKLADLALYRAKQNGRNTYQFFVRPIIRQASDGG